MAHPRNRLQNTRNKLVAKGKGGRHSKRHRTRGGDEIKAAEAKARAEKKRAELDQRLKMSVDSTTKHNPNLNCNQSETTGALERSFVIRYTLYYVVPYMVYRMRLIRQ